MTNTTTNTILVIGSTGKTGKRVADQLENRGIPVRHGSRSADVPFDWEDQQTWAPALAGVDKVYVTYFPDLAVPGSVDAIRALTELADEAGVRRLVLLSGRNEVEAERAEDVVKASGLPWTIVRCAFFAQNFNEGAWLDEVLAGTVSLPVDDVAEPFVDVDDIADVVVATLTDAEGLHLAVEPSIHQSARQQGAVGRWRAARAGTRTQRLPYLRTRDGCDRRVDPLVR